MNKIMKIYELDEFDLKLEMEWSRGLQDMRDGRVDFKVETLEEKRKNWEEMKFNTIMCPGAAWSNNTTPEELKIRCEYAERVIAIIDKMLNIKKNIVDKTQI